MISDSLANDDERNDMSFSKFGVLMAAGIVTAVAYAPMLFAFYRQQWSQPQSQFFPFVIAAYCGLLWWRWGEGESLPHDGRVSLWSWVCFGLACISLLTAAALYNPWLAAASFNVFMAGVTILIAQRRRITNLWGIYALLWLVMPLPLGYDHQLITKLQLLSSKLSSAFLDVFGVQHLLEGNRMTLINGTRQLFVDEACSGITSVMSIIACALIYGVWRNRTPLHLVLLTLAGVFWATMMNVLRISTIAFMLDWYNIDWTKGTSHELLGLVIFVLSFGALLATDLWLAALLTPVLEDYATRTGDMPNYGRRFSFVFDYLATWKDPEVTRASAEPLPTPLTDPSPVRFPLGWTIAFGILAITQLGVMGYSAFAPTKAVANVANARALTKESLPETVGLVRCSAFNPSQRERDDINGEFSRTYMYKDEGGRVYQVSCDFPFNGGWHELTVCYLSVGWDIDHASRNLVPVKGTDGDNWSFVETNLSNRDGNQGFLAWTMFDDQGQPFSPPGADWSARIWERLVRRSLFLPSKQVFQIQVFTASPEKLTPAERETVHRLLTEARNRFRTLIVAPAQGATTESKPAETEQASQASNS
jgi:exosortase